MKQFFAVFAIFCLIFVAIFAGVCVRAYLFPVKYETEVAAASEKYGVEAAVIFSCINAESRFDPNATSQKGAIGLMQLLPSTASSLTSEEVIDLTDPQTNIDLGTKYLATLISRFGDLDTALCAYNAGPTTVSGWLKNSEFSDDGVTLKNIPYDETKKYIKKFNRNLKFYRTLE